jgi:hypothetical protein
VRLLFFSSGDAHLIRTVDYRDDRGRFVNALGRGTWDFAPGVRTRHEIPSVGTSERDDSNEQLTFLRYLLCAVKDSPTDGHDREISDLPTSRVRA